MRKGKLPLNRLSPNRSQMNRSDLTHYSNLVGSHEFQVQSYMTPPLRDLN